MLKRDTRVAAVPGLAALAEALAVLEGPAREMSLVAIALEPARQHYRNVRTWVESGVDQDYWDQPPSATSCGMLRQLVSAMMAALGLLNVLAYEDAPVALRLKSAAEAVADALEASEAAVRLMSAGWSPKPGGWPNPQRR